MSVIWASGMEIGNLLLTVEIELWSPLLYSFHAHEYFYVFMGMTPVLWAHEQTTPPARSTKKGALNSQCPFPHAS